MNKEAMTLFRAMSGSQIMAIDRDQLYSAAVMAAASKKTWADDTPEDEFWYDKPQDAGNGVRVIPVEGIVAHGYDALSRWWFGMMETDIITGWIENAVADPEVKAIVLKVNSPGGYVVGTPELGEAVAAAAKSKPVIAHTSTLMASAAYWLSAGATLIYSTASAYVGSIGVFTTHLDVSRWMENQGVDLQVYKSGANKAAGIGGTAYTEEQKKKVQADIDAIGVAFRGWVLQCRPQVSDEAMDGSAMYAGAAAEAGNGLVDSIADLKTAIRDAAVLGARADKSPK